MAVLPNGMDHLGNSYRENFTILENYIRYMTEAINDAFERVQIAQAETEALRAEIASLRSGQQ